MEFTTFNKTRTKEKYVNGIWKWNEKENKFKFVSKRLKDQYNCLAPLKSIGIKFKNTLDFENEVIFRQIFSQSTYSCSSNYITTLDIKNLVLSLAPSETLTNNFIEFFYNKTVDKLFRAIFMYFEYFLKVVNFISKRRKEICVNDKIRTIETIQIEKTVSDYLKQYRLFLAREYSQLIIGAEQNNLKDYSSSSLLTSLSGSYKITQNNFVPFVTYVVWIAMYRKHYEIIENEIRRLFLPQSAYSNENNKFTKLEQKILFGENYKNNKFSPLCEELLNVAEEYSPILWIGKHNYYGKNSRILQIEMEANVPDSQIQFFNISRGILGHPKFHYNTMLVTDLKYIRNYDPFVFEKSPLEFPTLDYKKYDHIRRCHDFIVHDPDCDSGIIRQQIKLWKKRDTIVRDQKEKGVENDLVLKVRQILEASEPSKIGLEKIIENFTEELMKK